MAQLYNMCTMMIYSSTVKPDESQGTLKFQLIPPCKKHVLAFSLDVKRQLGMKIPRYQEIIYPAGVMSYIVFTPVLF